MTISYTTTTVDLTDADMDGFFVGWPNPPSLACRRQIVEASSAEDPTRSVDDFGHVIYPRYMESKVLRSARHLAGLSQAEAAACAGTAQSALSAYENGSKVPTAEVFQRILVALNFRPSQLVEANRNEILSTAARHHATDVRLFGSAARGDDTAMSDVDLLVRFEEGSSLFDLVALAEDLEEILGIHVDVVSEGGLRGHHQEIRRDAVPV